MSSNEEESSESETSKLRKIWDSIKEKCKKGGSSIGKFIANYGYTIIIPAFFFLVLISENYTLNVNSYRIIATFCSIIIGFGINSYFNLINLDINSLNFINSRIRTALFNESRALKKNNDKINEDINSKLEELETIDKKLIKIKNRILTEMRFFILISFFLLYLSIMAVSVIDSFSEIYEFFVLFAISIIGLALFQIFRHLSDFYARYKQYDKTYKGLHNFYSMFSDN